MRCTLIMDKKELLDKIGDAVFDLSLAINEEFGGCHQHIPERYRMVLILLSRYETLYVKNLAQLLHMSASSTSQLLSRMEDENYIVREADPKNRIHTIVKLGDEGQKTVQSMEENGNKISTKYLMELSMEDLINLQNIAIKIQDIIERKKEKPLNETNSPVY